MDLLDMTDFSLHISTDETTGSIYLIFLFIYNVHNIPLQYLQQIMMCRFLILLSPGVNK